MQCPITSVSTKPGQVQVAPFRGQFAWGDGRAGENRVTELRQPVEGGIFDDGFGEVGHELDIMPSRSKILRQ